MNSGKLAKLRIKTETGRKAFTSQMNIKMATAYMQALEAEVDYLRLCHDVRPKGHHDKNCTTCDHAEFRTTNGGRRMLDQPGKCEILIRLPHSFWDNMTRKVPEAGHVTKYTASGCPFHSKVK